jgi:hypothetical protein
LFFYLTVTIKSDNSEVESDFTWWLSNNLMEVELCPKKAQARLLEELLSFHVRFEPLAHGELKV